ncbi:acetyl-CoA carboxylase biotin carboxylase subunit [candidate division WOR_3 bacterium SM23_60]|uniref:Biotin carboxylase n=1 Tax=candidate division WOR_3 bacterium SM23_60 TaxID=1703780 RepID=A0A0S8GM58_UNCW3|nr:MAG: acetyl-CoA carboxylase biotin carboxylase subunit [candidate division WOR_3 bacterium SM23_60]
MKFDKILVANRGEIAIRIIRAAKELKLKTVAVYSEADSDALHTKLADEAVCIGPASSKQSYLNITSIISAAEITGAQAIHPGYGFLAENSDFVEICESCGITFIGPTPDHVRLMGDKIKAKRTMSQAGIKGIPGSEGAIAVLGEAQPIVKHIGFPVILKAASGGGGKGMRIAHNTAELESGFRIAQAEAKAAFGDGRIYVEKFIARPRHIEVQIVGDTFGNVVALGERECSIQRRHQKLIEESPSPAVTKTMRRKLLASAAKAASNIGYRSAGTIEFLMDEKKNFYFMEMNTRIQVEHPVTEMVSGVDLLKEQIKIALGEKIRIKQKNFALRGHAIECRINAEDPNRNFMPTPGTITFFHMPQGLGVRFDTHIFAGYTIPRMYDSLLGKLICHGNSRTEAIARMKQALGELVIEGIATTASFHRKIMDNEKFIAGDLTTHFIDEITS